MNKAMNKVLQSGQQNPYHAPYASLPDESRGRQYDEPASHTRTMFQRDRDRILHASAFRRLKHKTQVFISHVGDNYRTRLTHSLEVAQVSRSIARELALDEDLTETLALAHDLGHTPFGHAGETALRLCMGDYGGFDHNAQTLRIVTKLEKHYIGFAGLNMTWETLEGMVKHNGPLLTGKTRLRDLPFAIQEQAKHGQDLQLDTWPSLEAQVAALSDDIAYNNHDIDDGLRTGIISLEDLRALDLTGEILRAIEKQHGAQPDRLVRHELVRRLISRMIGDVVAQIRDNLAAHNLASADDVRQFGRAVATFSAPMEARHQQIKSYLHQHVYQHYEVAGAMNKAQRITEALFNLLFKEPKLLPPKWAAQIAGDKMPPDKIVVARIICDYVAGMTDRFAMEEYHRLFGVTAPLL